MSNPCRININQDDVTGSLGNLSGTDFNYCFSQALNGATYCDLPSCMTNTSAAPTNAPTNAPTSAPTIPAPTPAPTTPAPTMAPCPSSAPCDYSSYVPLSTYNALKNQTCPPSSSASCDYSSYSNQINSLKSQLQDAQNAQNVTCPASSSASCDFSSYNNQISSLKSQLQAAQNVTCPASSVVSSSASCPATTCAPGTDCSDVQNQRKYLIIGISIVGALLLIAIGYILYSAFSGPSTPSDVMMQ